MKKLTKLAAALMLTASMIGCSSGGNTSSADGQTFSGKDAMDAVGMSGPIQEIVNVQDATIKVDGTDAYTDLDIGTPDRMVYLDDNNYVTGYSYYNVMQFSSAVKQLSAMLEKNPDVTTIHYNNDETITPEFVADMEELVDKLNAFDPTLSLKYDFTKEGANYIAENGSASLEFHVQTNGYWGYDLAGDSIINLVVDQEGGYMENQELNNEYANFFTVDMSEKFEGMYILNDTDLQNPILFMNDEEALVVDVDFRGGETLVKLLKELVGDRDLYVYITHAHGDHYLNLDHFDLEDIKGIYYGKNDPISGEGVGGARIDDTFQRWVDADKIIYYSDGTTFTRAGKDFEVIEMDNHTPGGSQLLDITDRILMSGDTLGAQTFKGGTTIGSDKLQVWADAIDHSIDVLKTGTDEQRFDYIIGGHTNYLNVPEFELWVRQAIQEALDNGQDALTANPIGQNTIVVQDGKTLTSEENLALFADGTPVPAISDAEVCHVASINVAYPEKEEKK